jgi:hypothetical protein
MSWWAWIAIWGGLVLALLVMLALVAWWLFRKAMRLLDDVGELADSTAVLEVDEPVLARPQLAVLADLRDIHRREAERRAHRTNRRRLGHEGRLARARRITSVDATQRQWPADWY